MKKNLLAISLSIAAVGAFAQQDPQFTQNMFMKLPVNPGYAGTRDALCATTAYRTQWVGFSGAPKTFFICADLPVYDLNGGLGLTVLKDKLGNFNFTHARGAYSYHRSLGIGLLGIGLELGVLQASVENNWLAPNGSNGEDDPYIPNHYVKKTTYDIGLGAYYRTNDCYVGLSMSHVPGNMERLTADDFEYRAARHAYVMAGYYFRPAQKITIRPSVFAKSDGAVTALDLHCDLLYNDFVWGGLSYRPQDAIVPTVGIAFYPGGLHSASMLKIGYSYDLGISDMKAHHNNTHEIVVNYCVKWNRPIESHKSPRFMGDDRPVPDNALGQQHWID
jgi:type IX secretion system PorP/SprF family membrane protein